MTLSGIVSLTAWASVFCLAWGLLTRQVQNDWMSWAFFVFFLIVALLSGTVSYNVPTGRKLK